MSSIPTAKWAGASRKEYLYYVYRLSTNQTPNFKVAPGNYIFTRLIARKQWKPIYIGQTCDLTGCAEDQHTNPCIAQNGATHLHAHINENGDQARRAEMMDLVEYHSPPCNTFTGSGERNGKRSQD